VRGSDGGGKEEELQQHPQHQTRQEERGGGRGGTNEGLASVKSRKEGRKDKPKGVSIAAVVLLV